MEEEGPKTLHKTQAHKPQAHLLGMVASSIIVELYFILILHNNVSYAILLLLLRITLSFIY